MKSILTLLSISILSSTLFANTSKAAANIVGLVECSATVDGNEQETVLKSTSDTGSLPGEFLKAVLKDKAGKDVIFTVAGTDSLVEIKIDGVTLSFVPGKSARNPYLVSYQTPNRFLVCSYK